MYILIADDEIKMAQLLRKGLEEENHTITLAHDGAAGLEMAQCLGCDARGSDAIRLSRTEYRVSNEAGWQSHVPSHDLERGMEFKR